MTCRRVTVGVCNLLLPAEDKLVGCASRFDTALAQVLCILIDLVNDIGLGLIQELGKIWRLSEAIGAVPRLVGRRDREGSGHGDRESGRKGG